MFYLVSSAGFSDPVIWSAFGYRFEAGAMFSAIAACLATRAWIVARSRAPRQRTWLVEPPVILLAMLFTAGWIISHRPEPLNAMFGGTAFGALGARSISIALTWLGRGFGFGQPGGKPRDDYD